MSDEGEPQFSFTERVRDFHLEFGHPVREQPGLLDKDRKALRTTWMQEELDEFRLADTMTQSVDALIDLLYFVHGTFVEMGIDPSLPFAEVHAANMRKKGPPRSAEQRLEKIQKPASWRGPEQEIARWLMSKMGLGELITGASGQCVPFGFAQGLIMIGTDRDIASETASEIARILAPADLGDGQHGLVPDSRLILHAIEQIAPRVAVDFASSNATGHLASREGAVDREEAYVCMVDSSQIYPNHSPWPHCVAAKLLDHDQVVVVDSSPNTIGPTVVEVDRLIHAIASGDHGYYRLSLAKGSQAP